MTIKWSSDAAIALIQLYPKHLLTQVSAAAIYMRLTGRDDIARLAGMAKTLRKH